MFARVQLNRADLNYLLSVMPQKPLEVSVSGGVSHPAANGCVVAGT